MAIDIADIEANLREANPNFICSILQGESWVQYGQLHPAYLEREFNERVEELGSQFENHPQSERAKFWYGVLCEKASASNRTSSRLT